MNKQFGLPAPRRGGGGKPKDSDNHDNPRMKARVQKVYRHFRTATMGGCNGRSNGLDGSLSRCLGCFSFWVCLEKLWSILAQATDVCWPQLWPAAQKKRSDTSIPKIKSASSCLMLSSRGWIRPVAKLIHHITRVELAGFRMTSTGY